MKIAVYLTGLIIDKTETLPYIKHMFDDFASRNDLEIDYYCHFWDSVGLYPYDIDYNITKINVPWENRGSVNYALEVFNPKEYKVSKFFDTYYYFLEYFSKFNKGDPWVEDTINHYMSTFVNKNIHSNFFVENFKEPHEIFDRWWHFHVNWCRFVHLVSQAYTATESAKLIQNSNVEYDACIKWRYDVIADLITNNDKLLNAIKHCSHEDVFYTELAWEDLEWKEDLPYDINTAPNDKHISLHDGWWISSNTINNRIAESLIHTYTDDMLSSKQGQHLHFCKAIRNTDTKIYFTDRIQSNIIRFPDTIPHDYNNRPWDYFHVLYAKNFAAKKKSDLRNPLEFWDKQSQYHTIKYFNFY
jgi:hypothetical protein